MLGAMKRKRSSLLRMMSSLSELTSPSMRLPSSRAARMVTALAMPRPLLLFCKSLTSRRASSVRRPLAWIRMDLAKSMALAPWMPVRNSMAISSLSERLFFPSLTIFSRGRSSSSHCEMGRCRRDCSALSFFMPVFFCKITSFFWKNLVVSSFFHIFACSNRVITKSNFNT